MHAGCLNGALLHDVAVNHTKVIAAGLTALETYHPAIQTQLIYPDPHTHLLCISQRCGLGAAVLFARATVLTVACSFAMVKVKKILKRDVERRIAAEDKKMPFHPSPRVV